jgi:hypothetical protein
MPELERGARKPDFPDLFVFFDTDLITPNGIIGVSLTGIAVPSCSEVNSLAPGRNLFTKQFAYISG